MNILTKLKAKTEVSKKLRIQLHDAMKNSNQVLTENLTYRLAVINGQIVDLTMDLLKRIEDTEAESLVCATIDSQIHVPKNSSVNVYPINRYRTK